VPGIANSRVALIATRARLVFVIALSIVPAVLGGVLLIGYDYFDRERARLERDALVTARALVAAVDAELTGARSALQVLATSPHLASGDLRAFHAQARLAIEGLSLANIVLIEKSGRQLVNTLRPYGEPLPTQVDVGGLLRVFDTGAPVISDLFTGRVIGNPVIGIGVPVRHGGRIPYTLNGGITPERFAALVSTQRLPEGWLVGVFDSAGTVVARSHEAPRFVGRPGSPELVRRMKEAPEATFASRTLEGISVQTVYSRSPLSRWTVAIGIPEKELTTHLLYSLARLFVVAFIVLGAALGIGLLVARRVMAGRAR